MDKKTPISPSPSVNGSPSVNASPLTRRRIQEAIETDTDHNDNTDTVFLSSSPRRKLQTAMQIDVDVGEVKQISDMFVSSIIKSVSAKLG